MVTSKAEGGRSKQWRDRMARYAASGQQIKVFCQAEGVSEAVFYRWRQRLAAEATCANGFIAVQAAPAANVGLSKAAPWELRRDLGARVRQLSA